MNTGFISINIFLLLCSVQYYMSMWKTILQTVGAKKQNRSLRA